MTVITVDNNLIKVYDRLYRCINICVSMQVASMLKSASDNQYFRVENTQLQEGGIDSGLFPIAFTTEFCFGGALGRCNRQLVPIIILCYYSGLIRVNWELTSWVVLRMGRWHYFHQSWWGVRGQWRPKKSNFTVIAISLNLVRNLWPVVRSVASCSTRVISWSLILISAVNTYGTGFVVTALCNYLYICFCNCMQSSLIDLAIIGLIIIQVHVTNRLNQCISS